MMLLKIPWQSGGARHVLKLSEELIPFIANLSGHRDECERAFPHRLSISRCL